MTDKEDVKKTKRPYQKPQVEEVKLVVEEAVLQACKTAATTGPHGIGTFCVNPGIQSCSAGGS